MENKQEVAKSTGVLVCDAGRIPTHQKELKTTSQDLFGLNNKDHLCGLVEELLKNSIYSSVFCFVLLFLCGGRDYGSLQRRKSL